MKAIIKIIVPLTVGIIIFTFIKWKQTTVYDNFEIEQINVIVAKSNLSQGSLLTFEDLGIKQIPISDKTETMFDPTKVRSIKGKKLKTDVLANEPILRTEIE